MAIDCTEERLDDRAALNNAAIMMNSSGVD
jgi:hypothetical protein